VQDHVELSAHDSFLSDSRQRNRKRKKEAERRSEIMIKHVVLLLAVTQIELIILTRCQNF